MSLPADFAVQVSPRSNSSKSAESPFEPGLRTEPLAEAKMGRSEFIVLSHTVTTTKNAATLWN